MKQSDLEILNKIRHKIENIDISPHTIQLDKWFYIPYLGNVIISYYKDKIEIILNIFTSKERIITLIKKDYEK